MKRHWCSLRPVVSDSSRPEVKEALDLRNRAYTLLHAAVIEVRKTGEWLHRYAPERRAEYAPLPAPPKRPKPKEGGDEPKEGGDE